MELHIVDLTDRVGKMALITLNAKRKRVLQIYPMSNGVGHMVDSVVKLAAQSPTGMIEKLVFWSHGGPGSQGISRGTENALDVDYAGIDLENLTDRTRDANGEEKGAKLRAKLAELWDVLSWTAMVELHGCSVAQGIRGAQFLTILASIWGVPVRAGAVDQNGPNFGWVGTVHEARPGMSGTSTFKGDVVVL